MSATWQPGMTWQARSATHLRQALSRCPSRHASWQEGSSSSGHLASRQADYVTGGGGLHRSADRGDVINYLRFLSGSFSRSDS